MSAVSVRVLSLESTGRGVILALAKPMMRLQSSSTIQVFRRGLTALLALGLLPANPSAAQSTSPASRMTGISSDTRFIVYYGGDYSPATVAELATFDVVVLDPNIDGVTPALVASLQNQGVRYVLGYISIGEDAAPVAIPGDGSGPVFHDGTALVSEHGGVASFYVDQRWNGTTYESDGIADVNPGFGGRYIHPNADWRWVIHAQRVGGSVDLPSRSVAGLQQIVGGRLSESDVDRTHDFGFDGLFLDTLDTAGPYEGAAGYYAWTAPEMKETVRFIHETCPDKTVFANRGTFFHNPAIGNSTFNIRPYDYTIRSYVNAVVFESYVLDSNVANPGVSPFFGDNKHNHAQKMMAEANRSDGFTIFSLDYQMGRDVALYELAVQETAVQNGWVEYLSPNASLDTIGTYVRDNPPPGVSAPPVWDSSGSPGWSPNDVPDRMGVQFVSLGSLPGDVVVQWDIARDQAPAVRYHVYQSSSPTFDSSVRHADVEFQTGGGWGSDPTSASANEFVVSGLPPGTYYFRVRAQDSSTQAFEDTNDVTLSITVPGGAGAEVSNAVSGMTIDGDLAEWASLQSFGTDPDDVSGADNRIDWLEGWMAHDDASWYVAWRNDGTAELNWAFNVYLDTDATRASGFRGGADDHPVGAEFLLQGSSLYRYTGAGLEWSWSFVGAAAVALDGSQAELSFARALLDNATAIDVFFLGDNSAYPGGAGIDLYPDGALRQGGGGAFFRYVAGATSTTRRLTVSRSGSGRGRVTSQPGGISCGADCAEDFSTGTVVVLTASPNKRSVFASWSGDADCADGQVTLWSDVACVAVFDKR